MQKGIGVILAVLLVGLVGWNLYLTDSLTTNKKEIETLEFKLDMCRGDLDVITYDLVTARDSLRILHEFPERIGD